MFKYKWLMILFAAFLCTHYGITAHSAESAASNEMRIESAIHIDVPVRLEKADVVFNMDHLAFAGDLPIGIRYMDLLAKRYVEWNTKGTIIGIFHGPAAYMTLNDKAYNLDSASFDKQL